MNNITDSFYKKYLPNNKKLIDGTEYNLFLLWLRTQMLKTQLKWYENSKKLKIIRIRLVFKNPASFMEQTKFKLLLYCDVSILSSKIFSAFDLTIF